MNTRENIYTSTRIYKRRKKITYSPSTYFLARMMNRDKKKKVSRNGDTDLEIVYRKETES